MSSFYNREAISHYIARAIETGPRGTQSGLARAAGVPQPTANKWARSQTCPLPEYWPAIERYFGWEPGTIAGVGGVAATKVTELETSILNAADLGRDEREHLLRTYYILRDHWATAPRRPGASAG